jgi:hypothetical protein
MAFDWGSSSPDLAYGEDMLRKLGWGGQQFAAYGAPELTNRGDSGPSMEAGLPTGVTPEVQAWLDQHGYSLAGAASPAGGGSQTTGVLNAQGQPVVDPVTRQNTSQAFKNFGNLTKLVLGGIGGGAALSGLGMIGAGAGAGAAPTAAVAPAIGNGAFLGEGIASGVPAWDAAYTGAGGALAGGADVGGAAGGAGPPVGNGAFLGEGVASGVPAWDAAYTGAGGALAGAGAAIPSSSSGGPWDVGGGSVPTGGAPGGGSAGPWEGGGASGGSTLTTTTPEPGMTGNASVDKALQALGKGGMNGLQLAQLGLGGAAAVKQMKGAGGAQAQMQQIAGPAKAASDQLLTQFKSGQLNSADAFAIAQWAQQQKAGLNQYYSKAGLSNSSMHQQAMSQIDQQADVMRQQAVDNMLKQGLAAAGVANPTLTAGVTAGMRQDEQAQRAMQDFIGMLARMNTPQASQAPAPTPVGTPG